MMWKIAQAVTVCDSELFVLSAPPAGPRCPKGGLRLSSQEHLLTILLAQQHMAVSLDPRLVSCRYREGVLGIVSGDGESSLHRACIVDATVVTTYVCQPFQPLLWSLSDPGHPMATDSES